MYKVLIFVPYKKSLHSHVRSCLIAVLENAMRFIEIWNTIVKFFFNFDFDIKYIPSVTNKAVNVFSHYLYVQVLFELNILVAMMYKLSNKIIDKI